MFQDQQDGSDTRRLNSLCPFHGISEENKPQTRRNPFSSRAFMPQEQTEPPLTRCTSEQIEMAQKNFSSETEEKRTIDTASIKSVLSTALDLTTKLEREEALQYFVDCACKLTGAKYAAFGVLDAQGDTIEFYYSGLPKHLGSKIGHPPEGLGTLSDIPQTGALIVNDLSRYAHHAGFPKHHPVMYNFLGVLLPEANNQIWGRMYMADKPGGFTDADAENISLLASGARIAIQNARQYNESQNRARWLRASQNIVSSLLEGSDEEEALQVITSEMRKAAKAAVALMVLPSINDTWVAEFGSGEGAMELLGTEFPREGRARTTIREQSGIVVDSMQRLTKVGVEVLRRFGPAIYAPLVSQGVGRGVIILFRYPKEPEFDLHDLSMAENVAQQAAIALELAEARDAQKLAAELDERARIARDLHDLAIQQLFASGMHITALKEDLDLAVNPKVKSALDSVIGAIDESVYQIRKIVQSLREGSDSSALIDRLRNEASVALQSLGFAPSLVISWNGIKVNSEFEHTIIDDAIGSDIADDVVAVVRECLSNVARHAHAASVSVKVKASLAEVEVLVVDDGVGIVPSSSRRSGIANLCARAYRHRGTFQIVSRTDSTGGTQAHWRVPLR